MIEKAIVENYLTSILRPIADDYGFTLDRLPVVPNEEGNPNAEPIKVPILYFGSVVSIDRNAIGPGPRAFSSELYEVGIFHDGTSMGVVFDTDPLANLGGSPVSLIQLFKRIDEQLQDFSGPVTMIDGIVTSVQREGEVGMPEFKSGRLYRRDGATWRIHAKKA